MDTKNVFVKPDEQNQACLSSAMARKRRRSQRAGGAAVVIELTFDDGQKSVDKTPTAKSANSDLITQCIKAKTQHNSVSVKIVQYHKSPLLMETHDMATEAVAKTRKEYHHDIQ